LLLSGDLILSFLGGGKGLGTSVLMVVGGGFLPSLPEFI
jgi:hypothetical protein